VTPTILKHTACERHDHISPTQEGNRHQGTLPPDNTLHRAFDKYHRPTKKNRIANMSDENKELIFIHLTSSSMSHFHDATPCHFLMLTFITLVKRVWDIVKIIQETSETRGPMVSEVLYIVAFNMRKHILD
jgi:hypothetical protein